MKKVLIVEDAKDIRTMVVKMFRIYPVEIIQAENGSVAWKMIIKSHPDLILLDIHIPEMDGLDILKEMKNEWIDTPVVILSGDESPTIKEACEILGAKRFVNKPILPATLKDIAREFDISA